VQALPKDPEIYTEKARTQELKRPNWMTNRVQERVKRKINQ